MSDLHRCPSCNARIIIKLKEAHGVTGYSTLPAAEVERLRRGLWELTRRLGPGARISNADLDTHTEWMVAKGIIPQISKTMRTRTLLGLECQTVSFVADGRMNRGIRTPNFYPFRDYDGNDLYPMHVAKDPDGHYAVTIPGMSSFYTTFETYQEIEAGGPDRLATFLGVTSGSLAVSINVDQLIEDDAAADAAAVASSTDEVPALPA